MSEDAKTATTRWWQGQMVTCWHPDSPGVKITVWRPFWRKRRPFATLSESIRWHRPTLDVTDENGSLATRDD